MQPHKELTDRINNLRPAVSVFQIMTEAQVRQANYNNWQKGESEMMLRWFNLLKSIGVDPLTMKPDSSTYETVKKRMLSRVATLKKFVEHGYTEQTGERWCKNGDPRQVEYFKRVNHVVTKYEFYLQKEGAVL